MKRIILFTVLVNLVVIALIASARLNTSGACPGFGDCSLGNSNTTSFTIDADTGLHFLQNGESINNIADATFDFTTNTATNVVLTASDTDAIAGITVTPGGAASMVLGSGATLQVTVSTDGTGDSEFILPENSIGGDEAGSIMADMMFFCGESCNASTCAGGHSVAFLGGDYSASHALAATACNDLGETSIAAASEIASANTAFKVHGMYCVTDTSGAAGVTFHMTAADANLTPDVTCTIATGNTTCASTASSTTDVAAGAVVAASVITTNDLSLNDFSCRVYVTWK